MSESLMNGTIHSIAIDQLKPFIRAAGDWPVQVVMRDGRECHACGVCDQNLWFTTDQAGHVFRYTADMITTVKVAHIRQRHAEEGL